MNRKANLHYHLAEKLVLVLRDGRKLIGVLRSWDQFGMNHYRASCSALSNLLARTLTSGLASGSKLGSSGYC
jgi:small nuclear ribonucleoprotein (snRNP)-like protein